MAAVTMNLTQFIPLPVEEVEFSRKRVRLMDPSFTQFKEDFTDKDLGIYAAYWALDVLEYQNKTRGPLKFRSCEECEDFIEKLAKDRVNLTFFSKGITCHDRRDVQKLAIQLAREAIALSGYFRLGLGMLFMLCVHLWLYLYSQCWSCNWDSDA